MPAGRGQMQIARHAEWATDRVLGRLARGLAYVGGTVLTLVAVIVCVSIIGRKLDAFGLGPVPGDYELVEMGTAFAIFAFLPWCQYARGHVAVALLTDRFGAHLSRMFALIADALIALVAVVILWRLYLGFGEKFPYFDQPLRDALALGPKPFFAQSSYELEIPSWIPLGVSLIGAVFFVIVALFTVWRALNEMLEPGRERPFA